MIGAMLRCFVRIFCVVGLVVIVGMAVVGQFWSIDLYISSIVFHMNHGALDVAHWSVNVWAVSFDREQTWSLSDILILPKRLISGHVTMIVLPWWLILVSWSLLTALLWRLTRLRKVGHGFPIEPTAKSK